MSVFCSCAEGKIDYDNNGGVRRTELHVHNCDYVDWRNSLIPEAERLADKRCSRVNEYGRWSLEFHHIMNHLVREKENQ